jgi:arylsulfatase A-like enzyme
MCDQLRWDALGFAGNPQVRTPALDRLAAAGVALDRLYVPFPTCMPSRGSLLTGRYPSAIRMDDGSSFLDPREVTLPEMLQREGWHTGLFGKLHVTPQQYTAKVLDSDRPIHGLRGQTDDEDLIARAAARRHFRHGEVCPALGDAGLSDLPADLHPSWFIAESAAVSFRRHHRDQPCFLQVSFVDPHHPWDPPREIAEQYDPADMPLPRYADTGDLELPRSLRKRNVPEQFADVTPDQTRRIIAYYYAMIEMIDRAVAHVVAAVEEAGEWENTLFVFCADHGEHLGSYGLFRKGCLHYEHLIRSPGFVAWPGGIAGGRRHGRLLQTFDLVPTILSLVGVPPHPGMQGLDFAAALTDGEDVGREHVYCQGNLTEWGPYTDCITVRTVRHKLNVYPADGVRHLFDLVDDPDERTNLADDPRHGALLERMLMLMVHAMYDQRDPLPTYLSQF